VKLSCSILGRETQSLRAPRRREAQALLGGADSLVDAFGHREEPRVRVGFARKASKPRARGRWRRRHFGSSVGERFVPDAEDHAGQATCEGAKLAVIGCSGRALREDFRTGFDEEPTRPMFTLAAVMTEMDGGGGP
jgi:hypothetical protein